MSEVSVEALRNVCVPESLGCKTTDEMTPLDSIIGQTRAVRALCFGLDIKEPGFNVFVAGPPGTGRTTAVQQFLEDEASDEPVPMDLCYVYNFRDSYRPNAIHLPSGQAHKLQSDMEALVSAARRDLLRVFESEEFAQKREETSRGFQRKRNELFAQINERARERGFALQSSPVGLITVPLKDGRPLTDEELQSQSPQDREALAEQRELVQGEIKGVLRQIRGLERQAAEALDQLSQEVALYAIGPLIEDLQEAYEDCTEVVCYLDSVREDMLEHLDQFYQESREEAPRPEMAQVERDLAFRKYEVNVLVDNGDCTGAPVITELNPTYPNLFGRVEKESRFGTLVTDFTMIREGALHRANGGYLVLPALELLRDGQAWDSLKRSLHNGAVRVEEAAERMGFMATKSLRPEAVPLEVKVILIGDPTLYQLLYLQDPDFGELFKVKADFDTDMARNDENVLKYASFVCALCNEEDLLHLDRSAIAKIVEHSSRLAEDQAKLSTKFGAISDVIREASFYADQEDEPYVSARHIKRAVNERYYRSSRVRDRIQEMIDRGTIMIDVDGMRVGQVNGLSVLGLGDVSFGQPTRITASVGLGRDGVVDIERESNLGGAIHTKGVMILSGYLINQYAQDKPLSLSARLAFEQSYSGVDGDSASSTELYAILSSLSGLPIKQGIAVTGSVNQMGQVQAIGGVNEKIEGFFAVCQAKGLTGKQGVLIPKSNVSNLMLKDEVVEAVREAKFHVWAVDTIDQGIEILTGVPAGERREDGFELDTVHVQVDQRLYALAEAMRQYGRYDRDSVR